jgi:hypothetical protein
MRSDNQEALIEAALCSLHQELSLPCSNPPDTRLFSMRNQRAGCILLSRIKITPSGLPPGTQRRGADYDGWRLTQRPFTPFSRCRAPFVSRSLPPRTQAAQNGPAPSGLSSLFCLSFLVSP